jgi:hypothetical protein
MSQPQGKPQGKPAQAKKPANQPADEKSENLRTDASMLTTHQKSLLGSGFADSSAERKRNFALGATLPGTTNTKSEMPAIVLPTQKFDGKNVPVELQARDLRAGLRVPLLRPATVRGRVVDAMGQPVVGATVLVLGTGPLADRHLEAWRAHRGRSADPGAADPSFAPLLELGVVKVSADPDDARARRVMLTELGVHAMEHGAGKLLELEAELAKTLGKKQLKELHAALTKLLPVLEEGAAREA